MTLTPEIKETLKKFATGANVDFEGKAVPASALARKIRKAAKSDKAPSALTIFNAKIEGDLILDTLGESDRTISLQIMGCQMKGGFRGRSSRWRRLIFAKTTMNFLDLTKVMATDVLVEQCKIIHSLVAIEIEVGSTLTLCGSDYGNGQQEVAIQMKEARIGRSLRAMNITCNGTFAIAGANIGGEFRLGGSCLGNAADMQASAIDLSGTTINGPLDLCANKKSAFEARGTVKMQSAGMSSLAALGAQLDGAGAPAILAEGIKVSGSVLLGRQEKFALKVSGAMRFASAWIGGQFQLSDGSVVAVDPRGLVLDCAKIEGDILVGDQSGAVSFNKAICIDSVKCGGRLIIWNVNADATNLDTGIAISIRGSKIEGALKLYSTEIKGSLNIDQSEIDDVSLDGISAYRVKPVPNLSDLPEKYAHEDDALVSALYTKIAADFFCDNCYIRGGDLRLVGATVSGALRISRLTIKTEGQLALIAQDAQIGGSVMVAGSPCNPVAFHGDVSFLGATLGSSISLVDVVIGSDENSADLSLDSACVAGDIILFRTTVMGRSGFSSTSVDGDLRFEGAKFEYRGSTALYANGATVAGKISFASSSPGSIENENCRIDGDAFLEGAKAGLVRWTGLELAPQSNFLASGMVIEGSLEALNLRAGQNTKVFLDGVKATALSDTLDDKNDGWGGGKAELSINSFRYDRLIAPSGRSGNRPADIRRWRGEWLARRTDATSTQAARQLSRVLHEQGLHEGSRLVLMDAFSEEGRNAPTQTLVALHSLFGFFFGHGFSGGRALITVLSFWLLGTLGTFYFLGQGLLVETDSPEIQCSTIDPSLFAADVLLPVIDLGQEDACQLTGPTSKTKDGVLETRLFGEEYQLFSEVGFAVYVLAIYRLSGWILFSLALATWSGIFKRSGRNP